MTVNMGRWAWLAKADIKAAFWLLSVSPHDYELLGFSFEVAFTMIMCLPISCALSEKFSTFLEFRTRFMDQSCSVTHYLDDFLFVDQSQSSCSALLNNFTALCAELGVPLAHEKTEGPTQTIT